MCGIAGAWFSNFDSQGRYLVERALDSLRHRGPDDKGFECYAVDSGQLYLGHTRLSIIDLSQGGHQPMSSRNRRYSIIFNGEIYNYKELRAELISAGFEFASDSDTEVLLAAWSHWGADALPRLVGMFAFAVFDRVENKLTCVRDPFGIKPFFYSAKPDGFVFGSEIGAVNRLRGVKPRLDWQRAYDYLVNGDYDSGERTFFRDICHLLPGHLLTLKLADQEIGVKRWWKPEISERWKGGFSDAADHLRELFLRSVRFHLRSDVPLGAALSGGLDSSAVVCAMRHLEPDATINTFSFIAADSAVSEEKWVDAVNSRIHARSFKVKVTGAELAADLDDMIKAQGEPFGSTSIYAQYRVFKLVRESGVTVTLDGQGADELLGGYNGYPGARMRSLFEQRRYREAIDFLNNWASWPGRSRFAGVARAVNEMTDGTINASLRRLMGYREFPAWLDADLLNEEGVQGVRSRVNHEPVDEVRGRRLVAALRGALTVKGLPALLRHADRNSMRFSIESRVPFLTTEMAEFLLSLPEDYLVSRGGETKSIFRAAMREIVPDHILDRKDKIGFATPERDWLLGMADMVRTWLADGCSAAFIDQAQIIREFDAIVAGKKRFDWQVWRWVNFFRWHQVSFDA